MKFRGAKQERDYVNIHLSEYLCGIAGQNYMNNSILRFSGIEALSTPTTMLYLVGLGLADETDITVRGLEIVKKAERVYLEAYTSILLVDTEKLVR